VARRRLFVAVWPPDEVLHALAAIDRPARKGLRWTTPDQWHVTLHFLGHLDAAQEEAVRSELGRVDWIVAAGSAGLTAGPQPTRVGRTVWAVPVSGADALAHAAAGAAGSAVAGAAGSAVAGANPPADRGRPFFGHITLGRAKTPAALRGLSAAPFHSSWEADEVTLVCSVLHPEGARYEIVDRWSLQEARN
jgi:2'-5' RNA ligase